MQFLLYKLLQAALAPELPALPEPTHYQIPLVQ